VETILVTFFAFYVMSCVALIVMLHMDSRPGKDRSPGETVPSPPQASELSSPAPLAKSNQPHAGELPITTTNSESKRESIGTEGRIVLAYAIGFEAMNKAGGVTAPHNTLREFLTSISSMPPAISKPFVELTALAEIALYFTHKVDESMASRAEQLAATIKQMQIPSQEM